MRDEARASLRLKMRREATKACASENFKWSLEKKIKKPWKPSKLPRVYVFWKPRKSSKSTIDIRQAPKLETLASVGRPKSSRQPCCSPSTSSCEPLLLFFRYGYSVSVLPLFFFFNIFHLLTFFFFTVDNTALLVGRHFFSFFLLFCELCLRLMELCSLSLLFFSSFSCLLLPSTLLLALGLRPPLCFVPPLSPCCFFLFN